jgi:hypothetical protein
MRTAAVQMLHDESAQGVQPGAPVIVGQREAGGHLALGLGRMKVVGVVKFASERAGQHPSDSRFT